MDRREYLTKITITIEKKEMIKKLAARKGLKQITVLEYLLKGKINLDEFNNINL